MRFNYDMSICICICAGMYSQLKYTTQSPPPHPTGGQSYCAFVYCTFVLGEGRGGKEGEEREGEGILIFKIRNFFLDRPTDRQALWFIAIGVKKYPLPSWPSNKFPAQDLIKLVYIMSTLEVKKVSILMEDKFVKLFFLFFSDRQTDIEVPQKPRKNTLQAVIQ